MQKHPLVPKNPMTIVWLLLILCLSITLRVWILAKNTAEQNVQTIFSLYTQQIQMLVQERFKGYEQLLRGTSGLLSTPDVSEKVWQSHVQGTQTFNAFPEIRVMGFAPYQSHVPRMPTAPISLVTPKTTTTQSLLGYNLMTQPLTDTQRPTKPKNPTIYMGDYSLLAGLNALEPGFLLSLPIYPQLETLSDLPYFSGGSALAGYVFAWINAKQVLLDITSNRFVGIALRVFDTVQGTKFNPDNLVYQSEDYPVGSQDLSSRTTLTLFNHTWTIEFSSLPDLENRTKTVNALIWVTGILFSFVLFAVNKSIVDYNRLAVLQQSHADLKANESRLRYEASHDLLTGLRNRQALEDRFSQASRYADEDQKLIAVAFLDLDDFKQVNDTLGHDYGDEYLKAFADRLLLSIRNIDTAARIGGDEFIVLLSNQKDEKEVTLLVERILKNVDAPFSLDNHTTQISCSIGISLYPKNGETLDALIKQADSAMYKAKKLGKNQFQYWGDDPSSTA